MSKFSQPQENKLSQPQENSPKKRGRPKKIVNQDQKNIDSDQSKPSKGRRGRPPKNPLMIHTEKFENFLNKSLQWEQSHPSKQMMEELEIDEETLTLFFQHMHPESELRALVKKKNAPKKRRGRPSGSKNKSTQNETDEKTQIKIQEPVQEVMDFNDQLEAFLSGTDEGDEEQKGIHTPPVMSPLSTPPKLVRKTQTFNLTKNKGTFFENPDTEYHLTLENEKSSKFWKIQKKDNVVMIGYGKIGKKPRIDTKEFTEWGGLEEAQQFVEKETEKKKKKGYILKSFLEKVE
jgi:predicted DNA-binding WGR domain protein